MAPSPPTITVPEFATFPLMVPDPLSTPPCRLMSAAVIVPKLKVVSPALWT